MKTQDTQQKASPSRRDFLKHSGTAAAAATLAGTISTRAYAAEDNTIQVALVGCGGRGTGAAANALATEGPTKLVAMADVFEHRQTASANNLGRNYADKIDLPDERKFLGMDAYKKAIDVVAPGGVVILGTPPGFRPIHLEYAVEKGVNVFMEKSFAVDGPGIRRVLAAGKVAEEKNLKIAGGLMSRHSLALQAAVEQIHNGAIGEVITCWAYREHGPVGFAAKPAGVSELAHQIRNYSCYTWLNGSFILDWLIHNLDVCCWVKDAWPISAQGQGGRQVRTHADQLFDHYAEEYNFADGTRMFAQGRHMSKCWGLFGDVIHGSKGCAILGEGQPKPRLYKGHNLDKENQIWDYPQAYKNQYQVEHDVLFDAIRTNKRHNETERCAYAALVGILGRMAAESGQMVSWDAALNSELVLAPGLDDCTMESDAPVSPDATGEYPIAMPGFTTAF